MRPETGIYFGNHFDILRERGGIKLKKALSILFVLSLMLISLPISAQADTIDSVIDMHGTRTYLGPSSAWNTTWDSSKFVDVTDKDVNCSGSLTIKSGRVRNVSVSGSDSKLTVQGGLTYDTVCDGLASVTGGTLKSLKTYGDITVSGGNIVQSMNCTNGKASLSGNLTMGCSVTGYNVSFGTGKISLSGLVKATDIVFSSGSEVTVGGGIGVTDKAELDDCKLATGVLDGNKSAALVINGFKNQLPYITNISSFQLSANNTVVTSQPLKTDSLQLAKDSVLTSYSTVDVGYLEGPGTLCTNAGALTVRGYVSEVPSLVFLTPVSNGTTVLRTEGGASIYPGQVNLMVGNLEQYYSGNAILYRVKNDASEGLDLDSKGLDISSGKSGTVKAVISPGIARYATGTKIIWKAYGDTSGFSISPSSDSLSCNVSAAATGYHRALLVAYLVDQRGDKLTDYRADSCVLVSGSSDSGLKLDTSTVSVLTGDKYGILAFGGSGSKPAATSSNTSVASLSDGKETKDKSGNTAWLYTVTGGTSGTATIDIGGKTVVVTVNSGILMDTLSYNMSPKAKYCIGVLAKGVAESDFKVYSTNDCVSVKVYRRNSGGQILYQVTGVKDGTADVVFEIQGGQTVRTHITVKSGERSYGQSARLVALKQ